MLLSVLQCVLLAVSYGASPTLSLPPLKKSLGYHRFIAICKHFGSHVYIAVHISRKLKQLKLYEYTYMPTYRLHM